MKTYKIFFVICLAFILQSCYKPAKIQIKNNISQVEIYDVKWGEIYIASSLLPGQSSSSKIINKNTEKLPTSYSITFKMRANEMSVYLETTEKFVLNEDDDLLIILDDNTPVFNPNQ